MKLEKALKTAAKLILHIEDAANLAETVNPAYIGKTRDGLRAFAPQFPAIADLCREAANFIQSILDAKHACKNARFAGYSGSFGALFDTEFAAAKPAAQPALAARLRAAAATLRENIGIGDALIERLWGQEIEIRG